MMDTSHGENLNSWNWSDLASQGEAEAAAKAKKNAVEVPRGFGPSTGTSSCNSRSGHGQSHASLLAAMKNTTAEVEQYSQLVIKNRLVSADALQENMRGRTFSPLRRLLEDWKLKKLKKDMDWVTIGVLSTKSIKTSQKGDAYCVSTISDLEGNTISIFLFRSSYDAHSKEVEGSIVAIVNADVLESDKKRGLALSISQDNAFVKLGDSVDFGICKAKCKNGMACSQAINKTKIDVCSYHLQTKYLKSGFGRHELGGAARRGKGLFHGESKGGGDISEGTYGISGKTGARMGKSTGIYAGVCTRISQGGKATHLERNALARAPQTPLHISSEAIRSGNLSRADAIVAKVLQPKLNILKLPKPGMSSILDMTKRLKESGSAPRKDVLADILEKSSSRHTVDKTKLARDTSSKRLHSRVQVPEESSIFKKNPIVSIPGGKSTAGEQVGSTHNSTANDLSFVAIKARARQHQVAEHLKRTGVSLAVDSKKEDVQKKKRIEDNMCRGLSDHKHRSIMEQNQAAGLVPRKSSTVAKRCLSPRKRQVQEDPDKKARHDFLDAFKGFRVKSNTNQGDDILSKRSQFANVAEEEELNKLDSKLGKLEGTEYAMEQLDNVKEMEVKAYHCATCGYTCERSNPACHDQEHDIRRIQAVKRWFRCTNCKRRKDFLNDKIPNAHCHCGCRTWERCSMYRERKGPETRPEFKPTGDKEIRSLRF